MINRAKLQHILEYAKQQRHIGLHCKVPPEDMVEIVEMAMLQGAAGKPELTVWYGSMPESNGKANWTAILHRKGEGRCMDGFTIDRSEYPGRVLYAADRVRYLIGEKSERPSILDYDADAHSGYVKTGNSPVIPDGWKLVPVEPTAEMLQSGISAHYERNQIQIHDRPAPGPMECAYVAMLAAAPLQGAEPVTTKDDGGRYEQDDSPECGWVVTHSGKDYFYREQKDAVTHMNSAVESGLGVSLRSFIPEPVTTANKLPDGWVACSERMPEVGEIVLTSDGTSVNIGESERSGVNLRFFTSIFSGRELPATHWMPLPAAQQQEVK